MIAGGVDQSHDGPSRVSFLSPEKGGPAPAPSGTKAAASTVAPSVAPKAPRPVMHLITSLSVVKGGAAATVGCGAEVPVMPRADLFANASAWYSLTTCPDCRARVEHS